MSRLASQMELVRLVNKFSSTECVDTHAVPGARCLRFDGNGLPEPVISPPCLYLVVQGNMQMMAGDRVYRCGVGDFVAAVVDMPMMRTVQSTADGQPCLVAVIGFEMSFFSELAKCGGLHQHGGDEPLQGVVAGRVTDSLLETTVRLFRLLEAEAVVEVDILGPLVLKEFHYRFMSGGYEVNFRSLLEEGHMGSIAGTLRCVGEDVSRPIRIEDLATQAEMSVSSFHTYFKDVTAMSPLQYQKALRLMWARQLMLNQPLSAGEAALAVGYESGSQFNREYTRMFGMPPAADLRRLRTA